MLDFSLKIFFTYWVQTRSIPNFQMLVIALQQLSRALGVSLDMRQLSACVNLLEAGANPHALARVVADLQRVSAERRADEPSATPSDALDYAGTLSGPEYK